MQPGTLRIATDPASATVELDGEDVAGMTPLVVLDVSAGTEGLGRATADLLGRHVLRVSGDPPADAERIGHAAEAVAPEHVSHRLCPIDAGLCGRSHAHGRLTVEAAARSRASSPICYVPRREESLDDCALGAARCGAR